MELTGMALYMLKKFGAILDTTIPNVNTFGFLTFLFKVILGLLASVDPLIVKATGSFVAFSFISRTLT